MEEQDVVPGSRSSMKIRSLTIPGCTAHSRKAARRPRSIVRAILEQCFTSTRTYTWASFSALKYERANRTSPAVGRRTPRQKRAECGRVAPRRRERLAMSIEVTNSRLRKRQIGLQSLRKAREKHQEPRPRAAKGREETDKLGTKTTLEPHLSRFLCCASGCFLCFWLLFVLCSFGRCGIVVRWKPQLK